jgi:ABC-type lipoprotein export system ATPase subunit
MLELVDVTKKYKTKGAEVKALNSVSITFPSSGLVFISGKSGCGKTTMLNVIGGLDGIDQGEIFVQDKKFSEFSTAEYDAYRNTFIGFIFQEYNLLPEFSVEKNIKLAMELQGKEIDENELDKLLSDVEISDLKKRKISELSGGQRQRVAIARALVKGPRIIMADEPTGALDQATGIQVLEILKRLSKDKLIIVVSHDLEFAEKYADRIITLVDGQVEKDVSFVEKEIEQGLIENEDTLFVRAGTKLSGEEKETLATAVYERKKIEVIKNLNYREKQPTGTVVRDIEPSQALQKSKMKLKSAAAIGVKSVAVKPVRLFITVLISALAFAVFALFDTIANFNVPSVLKNQLKNSFSKTVVTTADYVIDAEKGDSYAVKVSQSVLDDMEKETGGKVKGIYHFSDSVNPTPKISEIALSDVVVGKNYYTDAINGFIEFDEKEINEDGKFKDFNYTLAYGEYPKLVYENGALVEESLYQVAISTYLADSIMFYLKGAPLNGIQISDYENFLGAKVTVDRQEYTIVGLVDCGKIPDKYDALRSSTPYSAKTKTLLDDYKAYINAGAQKCFFMANGFLNTQKSARRMQSIYTLGNAKGTISLSEDKTTKQVEKYVYNVGECNEKNILPFDGENAEFTLGDNEILIHNKQLSDLFASQIKKLDSEERTYVNSLISAIEKGTAEENTDVLKTILSKLKLDGKTACVNTVLGLRSTTTGKKIEKEVKIVGVYFGIDPERFTSVSEYKLMMNKNLMQEINVYSGQGDYSKLLFSERSMRFGVSALAKYMTSENGFALNWYNNSILTLIKENQAVIRQVADLFLYVAIALALFSVFMLYNYMSTSIANKKRSVGVLRALGAGGKDILCTFLTESLLISVFNGVLANVFAIFGVNLVNKYIVEIMNISVHFALFGVRQVLIISLVSLLTGVLSSILPIFKITKKKPVELIRRAQ